MLHPEWLLKVQQIPQDLGHMTLIESLKIFLSPAASLIAALISLAVALSTRERVRRQQSENTNITLLSKVWEQLGSEKALFKFHGISEDALRAKDLSVKDIGYLLGLFEAAAYHYDEVERGWGAFRKGSLRRQILLSQHTRDAWPFIREFFGDTPHFCRRVDATIRKIEQVPWWRRWRRKRTRDDP